MYAHFNSWHYLQISFLTNVAVLPLAKCVNVEELRIVQWKVIKTRVYSISPLWAFDAVKVLIFIEYMRTTDEFEFEWKRIRLTVRRTFWPLAARQIREATLSLIGDSTCRNVPFGPGLLGSEEFIWRQLSPDCYPYLMGSGIFAKILSALQWWLIPCSDSGTFRVFPLFDEWMRQHSIGSIWSKTKIVAGILTWESI